MKHNPALDGIRALAVLQVVAFHCNVPGVSGGFLGVDIFFVLSGFLITTILAEEFAKSGTIRFRSFYMQRVLRLGPALVAMLTAYLALAPLLFPESGTAAHWRDAALAAFYLSDYAMAFWHVPDTMKHTWSLSVEEHYYLLWPVALSFVLRLGRARTVALLLLICCMDMAWRDVVLLHAGWNEAYYRFDTRLTGLLIGAALALSGARLPPRWAGPLSALGLFVVVAAPGFWSWLSDPALIWGVPAAELASLLLISGALSDSNCITVRLLALRPLAFIGTISYAIYLWNYPIARLLRDDLPWYQTFAITLPLSLAFATASYFLIEKPINKWRKGLNAGRSKAGEFMHPIRASEAAQQARVAPAGFSPSPPPA
ncbi:MAG TPA: acyltransferase [Pseudolabrys sp.]|nr:acyltransferase [Pseudolabrys sp.]